MNGWECPYERIQCCATETFSLPALSTPYRLFYIFKNARQLSCLELVSIDVTSCNTLLSNTSKKKTTNNWPELQRWARWGLPFHQEPHVYLISMHLSSPPDADDKNIGYTAKMIVPLSYANLFRLFNPSCHGKFWILKAYAFSKNNLKVTHCLVYLFELKQMLSSSWVYLGLRFKALKKKKLTKFLSVVMKSISISRGFKALIKITQFLIKFQQFFFFLA